MWMPNWPMQLVLAQHFAYVLLIWKQRKSTQLFTNTLRRVVATSRHLANHGKVCSKRLLSCWLTSLWIVAVYCKRSPSMTQEQQSQTANRHRARGKVVSTPTIIRLLQTALQMVSSCINYSQLCEMCSLWCSHICHHTL